MAKKKATGLYSDQRGRIACEKDAPHKGSDTWTFDQWKPMTAAEAARFESEVGRAPACETCAAGATTTTDAPTANEEQPTTDAAPAVDVSEVRLRKAKKAKATASDLTLEALAERYLAHLEATGKSSGTLFSYRLEMVVALDEIGAKTLLSEITVDRVAAFFGCDRVMRTKTGVQKAAPSYLKTRRVLRQALTFAQETKLIAEAPLPETIAPY